MTRQDGDRTKRSVQGKTLMIGLGIAVVAMAGLLFWIAISGGSQHVPPSKPGVAFTIEEPTAGPDAGAAAIPTAAAHGDGGA